MIPAKKILTCGSMILLFGAFILAGCQAPPHAAQQGPASGQSDEGWLWRQLRGEDKPKNPPPAAQPQLPPQPQPQNLPQIPPEPPVQQIQEQSPVASSVIPATGTWVSGSPTPKGGTIVPVVAIEPIEPASPNEIPMSRVGPPEPLVTPPPELPPDPPPSIVSSNTALQEKKGFELADLEPKKIYKNLKKATGYGPNEKISRAAFKEGQQLFMEKKYLEAAKQFSTAADRWPETPLEEDAIFLQAESYFFADEYVKAHDTYEVLFKQYSNTRHLEKAVAHEFAIGRYWEQMQDTKPLVSIQPNLMDKGRPWFDTYGYAIKAYQNVRMYDPTGPLADHSVMAIATSYFRHNQFEDAAMEFDQLRKDYPNSEHQMLAHVLGMQAKMRVYQGKYYDQTALKEAHEIADSALSQFGPKLGPEQSRMIQSRSKIIEEKADRLFELGKYYEKNQFNRSARLYYQTVVDEYPRTQKAEAAKEHLAALQGKPDMPPDYFKWFTDLLPESKRR